MFTYFDERDGQTYKRTDGRTDGQRATSLATLMSSIACQKPWCNRAQHKVSTIIYLNGHEKSRTHKSL